MRIISILIGLCLLCISCAQNIGRLTSNLQAVVEGADVFRADARSAVFLKDGRLIINGSTTDGEMVFSISTLDRAQLTFGGTNHDIDVVAFEDAFGTIYTTDNPEASGLLDLRLNTDNTVSGEFNFRAISPATGEIKTFSRGFIFNIPIVNEEEEEEIIEATNSFDVNINTIPLDPDVVSGGVNNGQILFSGQTTIASVRLSLPENTPPGTYDLMEGTDFFGSYTVNGETFSSISGELIITLNENDLLIGSCDFITVSDFNVVGEFTINY